MSVKILLKQSNPEHAHNSIMDAPDDLAAQDATAATLPRVDPLDDVFGSDGGGDDDSPAFGEDGDELNASQHHPSDMHRLQQEHTTAGYRDGVTVAKAGSVQAGFDEGFGLGATIGLKVGRLLGLLEGIASALASDRASASASAPEAAALLADARAELGVRSVFSQVYWNADGTWKYDVAPASSGDGAGEEGETVLFSHVAEAHPLVKKWTAIVQAQMETWGLQEQLPLLQRRDDDDDEAVAKPKGSAKATAQPQTEAKAPGGALSW